MTGLLRCLHLILLVSVIAAVSGPTGVRAQEEGRISLAILGITPGNGVEAELADSLESELHTELDRLGAYTTISAKEIQALIGLEAQRQLMGCDDDSNCMAEVAGALGVRRAVTGQLARLGSYFTLNVSLLDVDGARLVGRAGRREQSIDELLAALPDLVRELTRVDAIGSKIAAEPAETGTAKTPRGTPAVRFGFFGAAEIDALAGASARPLPSITVLAGFGDFAAGVGAIVIPVSNSIGPAPRPLTLRLEARWLPSLSGSLRPFVGAGLALPPGDLGIRVGGGAEYRIGALSLFADLRFEQTLVESPFLAQALLFSIGIGAWP